MAYASASDLSVPLASGALSNPGRAVDVDATLDLCVLDMHGLATDDPVEVRAEGFAGSLPSPLMAGTTYYAIVLSQSRFQLAASVGGAAIDLTTAGENMIATFPAPVDAALAWASRVIDEHLPAHVVPIADDDVPEIVRMCCAQLAAGYLANRGGTQSTALTEIVANAQRMLDRWAKHVPVRGLGSPASLSVGVTEGVRACAWRRYGGL